jgi:hypothetical protein
MGDGCMPLQHHQGLHLNDEQKERRMTYCDYGYITQMMHRMNQRYIKGNLLFMNE